MKRSTQLLAVGLIAGLVVQSATTTTTQAQDGPLEVVESSNAWQTFSGVISKPEVDEYTAPRTLPNRDLPAEMQRPSRRYAPTSEQEAPSGIPVPPDWPQPYRDRPTDISPTPDGDQSILDRSQIHPEPKLDPVHAESVPNFAKSPATNGSVANDDPFQPSPSLSTEPIPSSEPIGTGVSNTPVAGGDVDRTPAANNDFQPSATNEFEPAASVEPKPPATEPKTERRATSNSPNEFLINSKHTESIETIVIRGKFKEPGTAEEQVLSGQFVAEPALEDGSPALTISSQRGLTEIGGSPVIVEVNPKQAIDEPAPAQPPAGAPRVTIPEPPKAPTAKLPEVTAPNDFVPSTPVTNGTNPATSNPAPAISVEEDEEQIYVQCEDPTCECRLGKLLKSHRISRAHLMAGESIGTGAVSSIGGRLLNPLRRNDAVQADIGTGVASNEVVDESSCGGRLQRLSDYFKQDDCGKQTSNVVGLGAAILSRNYSSGPAIVSEVADPTNILTTANADEGDLGGIDLYTIHRGPAGRGWEARYLGVYSNGGDGSITGPATTSLVGLDNLQTSAGTGNDIFTDPAASQSIFRTSEIHSVEVNFLQMRANTFLGREACMREDIFGFRYMNFDESLVYLADIRSAPVGGAFYSAYDVNVENVLFGFQAGRRMELPMFGKWTLGLAGKLGIFNNRITTDQRLTRQDSFRNPIETATINNEGGADFDRFDTKDDIAFLAEADAGLIYRFTQNFRMKVGYRLLGGTGFALAEDQIPGDFNNLSVASNAISGGDLFLDGGYFGFELAR